MRNAIGEVERALTRKFGPLPAWAWAVILGIVAVWWRRRQSGVVQVPGASGEVVDQTTGPGDPVALSPGEGAYDPGTGHLVTNPAEQLPPDVPDPVVVEPGEGVYNPGTGQFVPNPAPTEPTTTAATKAAKKKKKKKKKPHAKGGHKQPRSHHGGKAPHKGPHKPPGARGHKHKPQHAGGPSAPRPTGGRSLIRSAARALRGRAGSTGATHAKTPAPRHTSSTPTRQRTTIAPVTPRTPTRARTTPAPHTTTTGHPAATHPAPKPAPSHPAPRRHR